MDCSSLKDSCWLQCCMASRKVVFHKIVVYLDACSIDNENSEKCVAERKQTQHWKFYDNWETKK